MQGCRAQSLHPQERTDGTAPGLAALQLLNKIRSPSLHPGSQTWRKHLSSVSRFAGKHSPSLKRVAGRHSLVRTNLDLLQTIFNVKRKKKKKHLHFWKLLYMILFQIGHDSLQIRVWKLWLRVWKLCFRRRPCALPSTLCLSPAEREAPRLPPPTRPRSGRPETQGGAGIGGQPRPPYDEKTEEKRKKAITACKYFYFEFSRANYGTWTVAPKRSSPLRVLSGTFRMDP